MTFSDERRTFFCHRVPGPFLLRAERHWSPLGPPRFPQHYRILGAVVQKVVFPKLWLLMGNPAVPALATLVEKIRGATQAGGSGPFPSAWGLGPACAAPVPARPPTARPPSRRRRCCNAAFSRCGSHINQGGRSAGQASFSSGAADRQRQTDRPENNHGLGRVYTRAGAV